MTFLYTRQTCNCCFISYINGVWSYDFLGL